MATRGNCFCTKEVHVWHYVFCSGLMAKRPEQTFARHEPLYLFNDVDHRKCFELLTIWSYEFLVTISESWIFWLFKKQIHKSKKSTTVARLRPIGSRFGTGNICDHEVIKISADIFQVQFHWLPWFIDNRHQISINHQK